jgi:hypothetical protein
MRAAILKQYTTRSFGEQEGKTPIGMALCADHLAHLSSDLGNQEFKTLTLGVQRGNDLLKKSPAPPALAGTGRPPKSTAGAGSASL